MITTPRFSEKMKKKKCLFQAVRLILSLKKMKIIFRKSQIVLDSPILSLFYSLVMCLFTKNISFEYVGF